MTISREELQAKIESGETFFLVETLAEAYYRHTHLPGAIHLSPVAVRQCAPALLPDKNALIVLYCSDRECMASGDVARELETMGYTNVREYAGGKRDWIAAGLPVEGESRLRARSAAAQTPTAPATTQPQHIANRPEA
jgi:rhodanese-related sulfurtransferase